MNPPTLVAAYTRPYNDASTSQNLTVTTQAGDFLVVYSMTNSTPNIIALPTTPTGNGITFSVISDNSSSTTANGMIAWTGTDTTGGTNWTLNSTWSSGGTNPWGFTCLVFRNTTGTDDILYLESASINSPLYVDLETFNNHSGVIAIISDVAGVSNTHSWLTVDGYTPTLGNGNEHVDMGVNGFHFYHGAYYPDVSTAGIYNFGISYTGSTTSAGMLAIEVKGSLGGPTVAWFSA